MRGGVIVYAILAAFALVASGLIAAAFLFGQGGGYAGAVVFAGGIALATILDRW